MFLEDYPTNFEDLYYLISIPGQSTAVGTFTPVIKASRVAGVSPCTTIFSCDGYTAPGYDEHDTWHKFGYSWDFDDPTAGNFVTGRVAKTGTGIGSTDKNKSVDGPMAVHNFSIPDGGGSVDFEVLVNARAPSGAIAQASKTVTVQAQDDYYNDPANDTIAVSNTLDTADDWTAYHRSVPASAVKTNTMPAWDALDGKRLMLFNQDDFGSTEDDFFNIKLGTQNLVVTYFGDHETGEAVTASTISFNAPDEINDSSNGLAGFTAFRDIVVTGSTGNNYRFRIRSVTAGQIIVYDNPMSITTESAGGGVTLTEHHKRPDIGRVFINTTNDLGHMSPDQAEYDAVGNHFSLDGLC